MIVVVDDRLCGLDLERYRGLIPEDRLRILVEMVGVEEAPAGFSAERYIEGANIQGDVVVIKGKAEDLTMKDLWPDNISSYTGMKAPVNILREQGVILGGKTHNLVKGSVISSGADSNGDFKHSFYLVAPALSEYRYRLLEITHSIELYPLNIVVAGDVLEELPEGLKGEVGGLVADSEERYVEILRAIFATEKVKRGIEAIIAQST